MYASIIISTVIQIGPKPELGKVILHKHVEKCACASVMQCDHQECVCAVERPIQRRMLYRSRLHQHSRVPQLVNLPPLCTSHVGNGNMRPVQIILVITDICRCGDFIEASRLCFCQGRIVRSVRRSSVVDVKTFYCLFILCVREN